MYIFWVPGCCAACHTVFDRMARVRFSAPKPAVPVPQQTPFGWCTIHQRVHQHRHRRRTCAMPDNSSWYPPPDSSMTPPYVLEASLPENAIELSEGELSASSSVVAVVAATGLEVLRIDLSDSDIRTYVTKIARRPRMLPLV